MVLADLGADVIRVDRVDGGPPMVKPATDVLNRGKESIAVDLRSTDGVEIVLRLVESSDVLIEGFRPGVAERLGLGPDVCMARNPALVFGRMTGWGQTGPLADRAGHDINYIALSGALGSIGPAERPIVPLNLVGDFGGGGLLLAVGVLAACLEARTSGVGQVVDAAMVDGSALLMASHHGYLADGWWSPDRERNLLDGAAPFYTTYRTSDGEHMAVGALEPQFYAALLEGLELDPAELPQQHDRSGWPVLREVFSERFATRTRAEWTARFGGTDACVAPVLSMIEARDHPHNRERGTFIDTGVVQPAPAPRFSRTPTATPGNPSEPGSGTDRVLTSLGYSPDEIGMLRAARTIA